MAICRRAEKLKRPAGEKGGRLCGRNDLGSWKCSWKLGDLGQRFGTGHCFLFVLEGFLLVIRSLVQVFSMSFCVNIHLSIKYHNIHALYVRWSSHICVYIYISAENQSHCVRCCKLQSKICARLQALQELQAQVD